MKLLLKGPCFLIQPLCEAVPLALLLLVYWLSQCQLQSSWKEKSPCWRRKIFPFLNAHLPLGDISAAIQDGLIRLPMLQAIHWNPIMGATALLKSHGTHSTLLILVGLTNPNTDFHTTRTMTLECSFSYSSQKSSLLYLQSHPDAYTCSKMKKIVLCHWTEDWQNSSTFPYPSSWLALICVTN